MLEVSPQPAAGHAVNIGPLRGRHLAAELVEQLNSLFSLRHCGRKLPRREQPSAYGQMGRCLSPCLHDLDPNVYRRRLDDALGLFTAGGDAAGAVLAHVDEQMRAAAREERFERAAWLRRRRERLAVLLVELDGVLAATHARPRLVLAEHPRGGAWDAFWLVGGRIADWGPLDGRRRHGARGPARRCAPATAPAIDLARAAGRRGHADRRHVAGVAPADAPSCAVAGAERRRR